MCKCTGQCLYIVPDHINVSGGWPLFVGQAVGIERSADARAGLGGDPVDQPVIADIFEKNRRDFRGFDPGDDVGDIAGAGLGIRGNAERCDELDAVGGGKIAEGPVGRDHLALRRRDLLDRDPDLAVERVQLRQIAVRIGAKNPGVGRVGSGERVADVGHIDLRIGDRLPGMRIGGATGFQRRDAVACGHDGGLAAGGLHQPRQPALQPETVDNQEPGLRHLPGVGRCRRIDMHIAVRTDQARDPGAVTPDIAREIGQDRKAGDDVQAALRLRGQRGRREHRANQPDWKARHRMACYASR
jgi:hypothetical protein